MRLPPGFARGAVIVLTLLSAGFFAAYLRFLPSLQRDATYTDGQQLVELSEVERLRYAVWDVPVPLPATINTTEAEGRASLSPDGRLLVFAVGQRGLNADLWVAELVDGEPRDPRPLLRLDSPFDELAPAFGPDALWFASNRPGGEGGLDLWRASYEHGVFGPVEALPPGINTAADECDPAPRPGSSALAFASNRPRGQRTDYDLFVAEPAGEAVDTPAGQGTDAGSEREPASGGLPDRQASSWSVLPFEALNTPFDEREPAFTGDGLGLLLASDRAGTLGGFDLWRSVASRGEWLAPEPVPDLNTPGDERAPAPSQDGFTLIFCASDEGAAADLYRSRSVELFRLPGRPVGWIDLVILALLLLVALLAWLGRRWEALDILYKCVLVSLIVHLGLMLWFREVEMAREQVELRRSSPAFKVRLSPTRASAAATRERRGELAALPTTTAAASAPERHQPAPAPDPAASVQAGSAPLPVPELAAAEAPARAAVEVEVAARATEAVTRALALQDQVERTERLAADAPGLVVTVRQGPSAERSSSAAAARPTRRVPAEDNSALAAAGPSPAVLELESTPRGAAAPGPRESIDPGRRAASAQAAQREVALAAPALPSSDVTARAAGTAPELALDELAAATGEVSPSRAPSRPVRAPSAALDGRAESATTRPQPGTALPLLAPSGVVAAGPASPTRPTSDAVARSERPRLDVELPAGAAQAASEPGVGPAVGNADDVRAAAPAEPSDLLGEPSALALAEQERTPGRPGAPVRPGRWSADAAAATESARPSFQPLAAATVVAPEAGPDTAAREWEHTPYRTRFGEAKVAAIEEHGGSVETERAVALGLAYLAGLQNDEGFWGSPDDFDDKYGHVAVGKTALCLLAFLGAGHTPASATEHSGVTDEAVDFLLGVQDEATGHFGYNESYSHGIATYALAECYALTHDEQLRGPLERATAWLLQHQNKSSDRRRFGGWGYYYPDGRVFDAWPRTSITAWQVMALESARLGGLDVPDRAFADARSFLRHAHREDSGVILYSQDPDRLSSAYWTLPGSTPAGLFALSLLGEDVTAPRYTDAIAFVLERAPSGFTRGSSDEFVFQAKGNIYFWYYGSLALFRHGGSEWALWNRRLQSTLLPSQNADGSWQPIELYAEYAGDDDQDKSYTTALCVLSLEVYYRYFTPLLQVR